MARTVQVIVIAPSAVSVNVKAPGPHETHIFTSIGDFERWRRGLRPNELTIEEYVAQALRTADVHSAVFEPLFGWLCRQTRVPNVKQLAGAWSSPRSFFRRWPGEVGVSPAMFLTLVKGFQARTILERGAHQSEAMRAAGFSSLPQMRRAFAQIREMQGHHDRTTVP
jgi:methylphosphotriester-DNA--protein-cysteine methyltransferase